MKHNHLPLTALVSGLLLSFALSHPSSVIAQTREQAETQLKQMTPQQIEAKIKEHGMTREQAEAKAKEHGIDLGTYLQQQSGAASTPAESAPVEPAATEPEVHEERKRKETPRGSGGLPYFGYDVFAVTPAAFEPAAVGPADPEYVIGPDDVLRVSVWGQVEFQNELTVDKEGRIFIPTIGPVLLSGLTMEAAYTKLRNQMAKSYSGLVSRPPTVWMDLTIARLRPKRIFIMGEVANPGGYTVSSYATVFSSLFSVGGPTVRGSMRDIRVIRGNSMIARVDLYDYLTGAETTNDIRVQNNDIIFVPSRGKTVAVTREVRRPAIYELLPGEHLRKLLDFAGGALSTAYLERVQVDRIIPFAERRPGELERRIIDVNFRDILNAHRDYDLADGDMVSVYSIFDERQNVITITGAVFRPGEYQIENAPTIRTLIEAAEGLMPGAYLEVGHLIRYNEDWLTRRIIPFELGKIASGAETDWKLRPKDEVHIYSIETIEVKSRYVTIRGEVKNPGRFALNDNMTLDDLILLAGGYTEEAERLQAELSRVVPEGIPGDSIVVILRPKLPTEFTAQGRSIGEDTVSAASLIAQGYFLLQNHDEVLVKPNPDYSLQQNVTLEGDVKYPGVYSIGKRGERLSEMIARAGGPTATSYLGGAQLYRGGQRLLLDFSKALQNGSDLHNVIMFAGDRIVVPQKPHTVSVTGEVNRPGLLSFIDGNNVGDYIDRAGGLTDSANYAILMLPTGESRRVNFGFLRSNPRVLDGSSIVVTKIPAPPEGDAVDITATIKDVFAIVTSAATVAFIVWQVSK